MESRQETVDGRRLRKWSLRKVPPPNRRANRAPLAEDAGTLVDRRKPVSREGWQGRRNDTAAAEDESRHVMTRTLATECRNRAIGADW